MRRLWQPTDQHVQASFCDHAATGHGTLQGILSKVSYLHSLGVDIVWLSPLYESPQADMGYDISNYRNVDPRYGTLEEWEEILEALHARGMKLVMDLVVNHSSEEVCGFSVLFASLIVKSKHPWFKESRSSKGNQKRDWYIWRDAKYDEKGERTPPNNWRSVFGQ